MQKWLTTDNSYWTERKGNEYFFPFQKQIHKRFNIFNLWGGSKHDDGIKLHIVNVK